MEQPEKRIVGSYEIIQALQMGGREVVIGEDLNAPASERYMCAYYQSNELFGQYSEVMVGEDYPEIVKLFATRVSEEVDTVVEKMNYPHLEGVDRSLIDKGTYLPVYYEDDLNGKVVVIKPEVLRREYQQGPYQLRLCVGGFGASGKSRGTACFCRSLLTGETSKFYRLDIAGIMPMDKLPDWAKKGLDICKKKQAAERESR